MGAKRPLKVHCVFGTRPEAIKMAPVVKALESRPGAFSCSVVVTAQHRGLLDQVLELFDIKPDVDLDIMRPDQSLSDVVVHALKGLEEAFAAARPDVVLVHGDTTTTFVASLAAFYQRIPVGHVEAGLRTNDKAQPFPEEINRRLTSVLADLHFAPTGLGRDNLLREGVDSERVFVTGNTVVDALLSVVRRNPGYQFREPRLAGLFDGRRRGGAERGAAAQGAAERGATEAPAGGGGPRVLLVTAHRRENFGQPLENICDALLEITRRFPDTVVVYPVHPNPNVRAVVEPKLAGRERVLLLEPLEYEEMAHLMARSYLLLTDSGGLQEEAPGLKRPVLVLREVTERPEGVEAGTLRVVGTDRDRIVATAAGLLEDEALYRRMSEAPNPYGDGRAAGRIAAALAFWFGAGQDSGSGNVGGDSRDGGGGRAGGAARGGCERPEDYDYRHNGRSRSAHGNH